MRGKEYTIFYISLETKVPQDGATRPTAVNYPIARKYLYFLLGLKTGRGVKLIRINRLPFFFYTYNDAQMRDTFTGRWSGKEKRLKEKWGGARGEGRSEGGAFRCNFKLLV